jgi:hypothetical protein
MPVVTALGCGIGEEFDIEKLRYDKSSSWPMPMSTEVISERCF